MRPKRLTIEGLNSFIEKQVIDFDRLTSKGFFGIFGPTGSGKSTILDGITLALYGRIARGSAEFVNKQVDTLSLSYRFSLGQQEFQVEREIKRGKSGEIRTTYAKLIEFTTEGEVVLEDKASSVSKRCEDIIGLGVEDFSRTVVLPQGKFSEFLKLPNGQRREMLERIFNLEAYGAELSAKVARQLSNVKSELGIINGQLMGYEDLNDESLRTLEHEVSSQSVVLKQVEETYKQVESDYTTAKVIHERLSLYNETKRQLEAHVASESLQIQRIGQIERHEKAVLIRPLWQRTEKLLEEQSHTRLSVEQLKQRTAESESELKNLQSVYKKLTEQLELEVPKWATRQALLAEGRKDIEILMQEKTLLDQEKIRLGQLEKAVDLSQQKFTEAQSLCQTLQEAITQSEKKIEEIQIPESYKTLVRKVHLALVALLRVQSELEMIKKQQLANRESVAAYEEQLAQLFGQIGGLEETIQNAEQHVVADSEEAHKLSLKITAATLALDKLETLYSQRQDNEVEMAQISEMRVVQKKYADVNNEQIAIIDALSHEAQEAHWLAHFKAAYTSNESCPVCGQYSHLHRMRQLKHQSQLINEQWTECITRLEMTEAQSLTWDRQDIEKVMLFSKELEAKLLWLKNNTEEKQATIKAHREAMSLLLQKRSKLSAELEMVQKQFSELKLKASEVSETTEQAQQSLLALKEGLSEAHQNLDEAMLSKLLTTFEESEKQLEILGHDLRRQRENLNEKNRVREQALQAQMTDQNALEILKSSIELKTRLYQENKDKLTTKLGPLMQVKEEHERLTQQLERFDIQYRESKTSYEKCLEDFNRIQSEYVDQVGRLRDLEESLLESQETLHAQLSTHGFDQIRTAKESLLEEHAYQSLKVQTRAYQQRRDELCGTLDSLKTLISDTDTDSQNFESLTMQYETLKIQMAEGQQRLAQLNLKLEQTQERLVALSELLSQKSTLSIKQAELQDLAKLFEARKFVAFIASTQMAYISGKASEQLLEMTQGNYGIEAQSDGSFLVRDYKNGGVTRDVSTLSGGETFLVSLSLALALSAQVQLKGKAPLELFFLDEGFGTLDDDTLEVVMTALESLSHEKLAIGLISHVESIKNRVPIKLIVSPSKAGLGGSKVKIELS